MCSQIRRTLGPTKAEGSTKGDRKGAEHILRKLLFVSLSGFNDTLPQPASFLATITEVEAKSGLRK